MAYHPYHFVGEVLLHPVYHDFLKFLFYECMYKKLIQRFLGGGAAHLCPSPAYATGLQRKPYGDWVTYYTAPLTVHASQTAEGAGCQSPTVFLPHLKIMFL